MLNALKFYWVQPNNVFCLEWVSTENVFNDEGCENIGSGETSSVEACQESLDFS